LIPSWAKDKKTNFINARSETLMQKAPFRVSFKKRRCLILADGYYEWKTLGPKQKQAHYFCRADNAPLAFAGIWDIWKDGDEVIESCLIITTGANELSRPIHDRMPAILVGADADAWLDPEVEEPEALLEILRPFAAQGMSCSAVGPLVNSVRNNGAACIEPIVAVTQGSFFDAAE
jgi:putative SOS response-associated peptidase YedK